MPSNNIFTTHKLARLKQLFDHIDHDHDRKISPQEMMNELDRVDFSLCERGTCEENRDRDIEILWKQAGLEPNESVSFKTFVQAMENDESNWGADEYSYESFLVRHIAKMHYNPRQLEEIQYHNKTYFCPPRLFVVVITAIQIGIFVNYDNEDCTVDFTNGPYECPQSFNTPMSYRICCRDEVWRFITYGLLHANWNHLLSNIVIQLIFGIFLEIVNGPLRVGLLYIAGMLAGGLASSVIEPQANVVGASGAVYALVGAWVGYIMINWDTLEAVRKWIGAIFLVILVGLDFGQAIYLKYIEGEKTGVSVAGHVGGFLLGASFGTWLLRNHKHSDYERYFVWWGLSCAITAVIFAIFVNVFNDPDVRGYCAKRQGCYTS